MEKNDAQNSDFAVVKRAPSPWEKKFSKKNPSSLFVRIRATKSCAEIFKK